MAGKPKLRTLKLRIIETGGFEALLARVADGEMLRDIALEYATSPAQLSWLLTRPEWKEKYDEAKKIAASVRVEDAFAGVQRANPMDVQVRRLQFDAALKLAGVHDKATFGEQKTAVQVNLSINDLHLQALKQPRPAIDVSVSRPAIEAETDPEDGHDD